MYCCSCVHGGGFIGSGKVSNDKSPQVKKDFFIFHLLLLLRDSIAQELFKRSARRRLGRSANTVVCFRAIQQSCIVGIVRLCHSSTSQSGRNCRTISILRRRGHQCKIQHIQRNGTMFSLNSINNKRAVMHLVNNCIWFIRPNLMIGEKKKCKTPPPILQ